MYQNFNLLPYFSFLPVHVHTVLIIMPGSVLGIGDHVLNETGVATTLMNFTVLQWSLSFGLSSILSLFGDHPSLLQGADPPLPTTV